MIEDYTHEPNEEDGGFDIICPDGICLATVATEQEAESLLSHLNR